MSTEGIVADVVDARPGHQLAETRSGPSQVDLEDNLAKLSLADYNLAYAMNNQHRGKFIVINNVTFQAKTGMQKYPRTGSDVDAENLKNDFTRLGFDVTVRKDLTIAEMKSVVMKALRDDEYNKNCDCFGLAVLTHGDNNVLFGVDDTMPIENLVAPIKGCESLVGKPKILIIQACRGNMFDEGISESDATGSNGKPIRRLPMEADFLYAYSTVPGYFAWRNQLRGSWFVQALHKVLVSHAFTMDLVKLLTFVNFLVAYEFESKGKVRGMKQISSIVSMLTKDLQFTDKNKP